MASDALLKTAHTGAVVDLAASGDGKLLATAGEDGLLCVYTQQENEWTVIDKIQMPSSAGGINCIAWGSAVLVCTEDDRSLRLYASEDPSSHGEFQLVYETVLSSEGLCAVWAPAEYGAVFAVGCKDGNILLFHREGNDNQWNHEPFPPQSTDTVNSLSFAPFTPFDGLRSIPLTPDEGSPLMIQSLRIVSGAGTAVTLWSHAFVPVEGEERPRSVWTPTTLSLPVSISPDRVWTQVSWAPSIGLPLSYIAAGREDGCLVVFSQDGTVFDQWIGKELPRLSSAITRLSWSQAGGFLLASAEDGSAVMYHQEISGEWESVSDISFPTGEEGPGSS